MKGGKQRNEEKENEAGVQEGVKQFTEERK
jgi:hypothetical protein